MWCQKLCACLYVIDFNEAFFPTMSCSSLTEPAILPTNVVYRKWISDTGS